MIFGHITAAIASYFIGIDAAMGPGAGPPSGGGQRLE